MKVTLPKGRGDWQSRIVGHGEEAPDQLLAHPNNFRVHPADQQQALAGSLDTLGWVDPVIVNRTTGHVIDGHLRVAIAQRSGAQSVPVVYVELTEAEEAQALLSLDPIAAMAATDKDNLDTLLRQVQTDDERVMDYLAELAKDNGLDYGAPPVEDVEPQIDRAEELRAKWGVEPGQLWQLGDHRLICGDCTDRAVVEKVMQGERAELVVTSPPYGVGKDYETSSLDDWRALVSGFFSLAMGFCSLFFINLANRRTGNDGYEANTFGEMVNIRMWTKDPAWAGQAPYWNHTYKPVDDFEFLGLFGEKPKHKNRLTDEQNKTWGFRGVWNFASVARNQLHSAAFPVELPERALSMLTDPAAIVYEPFSGSGTTLIACERLGRKCRAVEISPAYVAVALERWAQATGKTPTRVD